MGSEYEQLHNEHSLLKGVVKEMIKEIYVLKNTLGDARDIIEAWDLSCGGAVYAGLLSKINTVLNDQK